jgi:hypothetical protein
MCVSSRRHDLIQVDSEKTYGISALLKSVPKNVRFREYETHGDQAAIRW